MKKIEKTRFNIATFAFGSAPRIALKAEKLAVPPPTIKYCTFSGNLAVVTDCETGDGAAFVAKTPKTNMSKKNRWKQSKQENLRFFSFGACFSSPTFPATIGKPTFSLVPLDDSWPPPPPPPEDLEAASPSSLFHFAISLCLFLYDFGGAASSKKNVSSSQH